MLRITAFVALLIASCGYALWKGGQPERIAASAMLMACGASALVRSDAEFRFVQIETGLFVVDALLLIILCAVALKADRGWPLFIAALHLATVGAHAVKLIDPAMIRVTYVVMISGWSWPMLFALAVGTARHGARLRMQGHDPDWSLPVVSGAGPLPMLSEGLSQRQP